LLIVVLPVPIVVLPIPTQMLYTSTVRKCLDIEIRRKFNLMHEKEWTGYTISIICKRYGTSRKTHYNWNNRYKQKQMKNF
jgi:hypothetical protein